MSGTRCEAITRAGARCQMRPLHDEAYCFAHSPTTRAEAEEARKLGGRRRRRENTLAGAFELDDVCSVAGLQRLVEIVATDVLAQENSLHRAEVLIALANFGVRLLGQVKTEDRVAELERALMLQKGFRS